MSAPRVENATVISALGGRRDITAVSRSDHPAANMV
jgi:hypothetical protein